MSPQNPASPPVSREKASARAPRAWQRMLSGRRLDLLDPSPLDIEIADIAHGLARVARWNGQTHGPHIFSVAQHSLLVEAIVEATTPHADRVLRMFALLHDAPEYVVGDIISPFKAVIGDAYRATETRLHQAVLLRFGLPTTMSAALARIIKSADRAAAFHEATNLAGFAIAEAHRYFGRPDVVPPHLSELLQPLSSAQAQALYLARFEAVDGDGARCRG